MKRCPKCGIGFSDNYDVCQKCGTPLVVEIKPPQNNNSNIDIDIDKLLFGNKNPYNGSRIVPFYEQTWCIVLSFILFFPVGLSLLILRICDDKDYKSLLQYNGEMYEHVQNPNARPNQPVPYVKKKRKGRKIAGIILAALGAIISVSAIGQTGMSLVYDLVMGIGCMAGGAGLIGVHELNMKREALYESLINNRGNTPIKYIAERLGKSEKKVRTALQNMLNNGFLSEPKHGIGAYINGEHDLLVITKNGYPIVPVEDTLKQQQKDAKKKEEANRPRTPEDDVIDAIKDASNKINDAETLSYLRSMDASVKNIKVLLEQDPAECENQNIRNFRSKYIPQTVDLIKQYTLPATSESAKANISGMFCTLAEAFNNIEKQLRKNRETSTEVDIEVMRQKLERDGLLDSDFFVE